MIGENDEVDLMAFWQRQKAHVEITEHGIDIDDGLSRFPTLRTEVVPAGIRLLQVSHDEIGTLAFYLADFLNDGVEPLRHRQSGLIIEDIIAIRIMPTNHHVRTGPVEDGSPETLLLGRQPYWFASIIIGVELLSGVAQRKGTARKRVVKRIGNDAVDVRTKSGSEGIMVRKRL